MISVPTNGKSAKPKFPLGQVLATPGALEALEESGESPARFLSRHVTGHPRETAHGESRHIVGQPACREMAGIPLC